MPKILTGKVLRFNLKFDYERILNVKVEELGYVRLLFLHNFFQGIGLAMFFSAANSIFLTQVGSKSLPLVYMFASLLLLSLGITYSYFERRISIKKLLLTILILLTFSILLIRIGLSISNSIWIAFAAIMWYRATQLLNYLEFWGLTSMMLDIRQSKRLFGLVSSGEVTAKLLGYFSIPLLVPIVGKTNLIFISSVSFAICFIILQIIAKKYGQNKLDRPKASKTELKNETSVLSRYLKSHFIIMLSVLSFVSILVFTFIDFSFLSNLQLKFKDADSIAVFLGWFYGFNKGVTVLIKMFFTGRIIDKLGIKNSLLLIPGIFLVIICGIIFYRMLSPDVALVFSLFSLLLFVMEALRYSLFEPVFFSLFQPLNKNLRLFGHAIVNGYLNPIALGIAGLTLYLFIFFQGVIDLGLISFVLIAFLICWIVLVIVTNRQYIIVLHDAIKKRFFEGSDMHVKGKVMQNILQEKLRHGMPEEVIYSSTLLLKTEGTDKEGTINILLENPSVEVLKYTLNYIQENRFSVNKDLLLSLITGEETDSVVKDYAIRAYCCMEDADLNPIYPFLEDNNEILRKGAIIGLLKNAELEAVVLAGQKLLTLLQSIDAKELVAAIEIIGILKVKNFYQPVILHLNNRQIRVKKAAIITSGQIANPKLIPNLIQFLSETYYGELALKALIQFGDEAVNYFDNYIKTSKYEDLHPSAMFRITQVLGSISSPASIKLLLELMNFPSVKVQNTAILNLKKSSYKAVDDELIRKKFDDLFEKSGWFNNAIYLIEKTGNENKLLLRALQIELAVIKENLLYILSFLYDTHTVIKAREGLLADYGEKKANALEIIDNLITKKMAHKLSVVFEDCSLEDRLKNYQVYDFKYPATAMAVVESILKYRELKFNRWTQVTAIISLLNYFTFDLAPLIIPFLDNKSKLLSETAKDTINKISQQEAFSKELFLNKLENEKLIHLMDKSSGNNLLDIEKVIILKGTSLFSETPENILVDIAGIVKEERVEEGQRIMEKGEMGFCMYIICDGEIRIHDNDITFTIFKNRDFFGELALLDPEPRSASATALKDSLLLRIDQEAFYEVMSERMEVAKGILKILCRRLRNQNEIIKEMRIKIPATDHVQE